jgi:hypothetical protein
MSWRILLNANVTVGRPVPGNFAPRLSPTLFGDDGRLVATKA